MQIEINEKEYCKLDINYEATKEEILTKKEEVVNIFKNMPVPGFRKGKADLTSIKLYYAKQIDDSLKKAMCEEALQNTIFEKQLNPLGPPTFISMELENNNFKCNFLMNVKPTFELQDYKSIEVPKPAEKISAGDLTEKFIQELRFRYGTVMPYTENDFVQFTDNVIIDYEASVDGVPVEGLSAVGEMITVGNNDLKEFDENLLGMTVGETRNFEIKMPENALPSIANKVVSFKVSLQMGSKNTPAALNADLAMKMGKSTYEELREYVASVAMGNVANTYKNDLHQAIAARLVDMHDFKVPEYLSLSEAQYVVAQAKLNWETIDEADKNQYKLMAEKNVKLALVLDKIRSEEPNAQITDQEVFEIIKTNLAKTQQNVDINKLIENMQKTGYLQVMFSRIKDEYVMDYIAQNIKIVE